MSPEATLQACVLPPTRERPVACEHLGGCGVRWVVCGARRALEGTGGRTEEGAEAGSAPCRAPSQPSCPSGPPLALGRLPPEGARPAQGRTRRLPRPCPAVGLTSPGAQTASPAFLPPALCDGHRATGCRGQSRPAQGGGSIDLPQIEQDREHTRPVDLYKWPVIQ